MLNRIFAGLFASGTASGISVTDFLLCILTALVLGIIQALIYAYKSRYTRSFMITLSMLPAVVSLVIMLVSGNLGAGIAVAGTFSLVRFRSVPGTAREICSIFLAMAAGLAVGMGYLGYAVLFTVIMGLASLLLLKYNFGERKGLSLRKKLRITIPEDLDYGGVFDGLLKEYSSDWQLIGIKTTNMGSLCRLTYNMTLKDCALEKELIDKLRCRNGNLEISMSLLSNENDL